MSNIRQVYRRLDSWASGLSRGKYAILIGATVALGSLAVTFALGDPDYAFATGISLTMTVLYYWSNPNQKEE